MDETMSSKPRHLRRWSTVAIAYIAITALLGIMFLIMYRSARSNAPTVDDALRVGSFTVSQRASNGTVPATNVAVITDTDPSIGASAQNAKLTIVEFSDFQCQFCRQAFPIIRSTVAAYGDRGLRYIYRDFFDEELHTNARLAAEAARCANAQGKFWAYHDKLFLSQNATTPRSIGEGGPDDQTLNDVALRVYAREIGLDGQQFDVCIASKQFTTDVQKNVDAGTALGVRGTPTWFLIPSGVNALTRRVEGVIPQDKLVQLLKEKLPLKKL